MRFFTFLIIFLSILTACFFIITGYKFYNIEKIKKDIISANTQFEFIKNKEKQRAINLKNSEKHFHNLSLIFVKNKDVSFLFEDISKVGKDNKIKLISFKPEEDLKENFFSRIKIYVSISGSFNNVVNFFKALSDYKKLLVIDKINFKLSNNEKKLVTDFSFFVYRLNE
jgi:type IV pilus assembly protein PilO